MCRRIGQPLHTVHDCNALTVTVSSLKNCVHTPGLSDPYIVVKYGGATMFRSRVVKKSLNPDWDESATLSPPSTDEIIKVVCCPSHVPFCVTLQQ